MKRVNRYVTLVTVSLILGGCGAATKIQTSLTHQLEAAFGYSVIYNTVPSGADLFCDDKRVGVTPKNMTIKAPDNSASVLNLGNCHAVWKSGARVDFDMSVPLDTFGKRVVVTKVLSLDSPGYAQDLEVGKKHNIKMAGAGAALMNSFNMLVGAYNNHESMEHSEKELERAYATAAKDRLNYAGKSAVYTMKRRSARTDEWVNIPMMDDSFISKPYQPVNALLSPGFTGSQIKQQSLESPFHPIELNAEVGISPTLPVEWVPIRSTAGCYGTVALDMCFGVMQGSAEPAYCSGALERGICKGVLLSVDSAHVM